MVIAIVFIIIIVNKIFKTDNDNISRSTMLWNSTPGEEETYTYYHNDLDMSSVSTSDIPKLKIISNNTEHTHKLKWTSVENAISYNVYMVDDPTHMKTKLLVKSTTDTFSLYPLTPRMKYIAVTAILDDFHETKLSNWVPTNLFLTEPLNNAIFKNIAPPNAIPTYENIPHIKIVKSFIVPPNNTPINISDCYHLLKF